MTRVAATVTVAIAVSALPSCADPVPLPHAATPVATSIGRVLPDFVVVAVEGLRAATPDGPDPTGALLTAFPAPPLANFHAAYTTSSAASTSFGSLLTGRYPAAIPLCRVREGAAADGAARAWCTLLPDDRASLPDILANYGYHTALLTTGGVGFDTFFKRFQTTETIALTTGAADPPLATAAGQWWSAHAGHPRLLVVHIGTMAAALDFQAIPSPEMPTVSPDHSRSRQVASGQEGPAADMLALGVVMQKRYGAALATLIDPMATTIRALPASPERPVWTTLVGLFGANLAETTGFEGWRLGLDSRQYLLERTLHVPIVVWGPPHDTSDRHALVELTDVVPTLLSRADAVYPAGASGRDLLSVAADPTPWAYAEFGDMLSVRQGRNRLTVRTYVHDSSSLDPVLTETARALLLDRSWTLHDVVADPVQARNLLLSPGKGTADAVLALHRTMIDVRTGSGAPPPDRVTPERLWALRMSAGQGYW